MNLVAKHIVITGKVQGVFFRKHTRQKANELNIFGWVKNTIDEKVEITAQGNQQDLNQFIDWCKQGPPKAEVKNLQVEEKQTDSNLKEFSILYKD